MLHQSSSNHDISCAATDDSYAVYMRNVCFRYHNDSPWNINHVNVTILQGEHVAIVGPNGSGKSTLAKLIAGLTIPDQGSLGLLGTMVVEDGIVNHQAYRQTCQNIGTLFQSPDDQIITTVCEDDIAFGLENIALPQQEMHTRITAALSAVGMSEERYKDPTIMSGGQQQRIALAGALAMQTRLLVLDEPTSMLDTASRNDVDNVLAQLHAQGTTIVQVTHRFEECARAQRILLFEHETLREISLQELRNMFTSKSTDHHLDAHNKTEAKLRAITTTCTAVKPYALDVSHLSIRYARNLPYALEDCSLHVYQGETVAVMGKNGSGKSTLAKAVSGLIPITSGCVRVNELQIQQKSSHQSQQLLHQTVGYVMQQPEQQLFAETVFEDVMYGPKNFGLRGDALKQRVQQTLTLLGIENLAQACPFDLSGGQQRLVAIAGILAYRPSILILDEPTAGLDLHAKRTIMQILRRLQAAGVSMMIITHNEDEARELNARIIHLTSVSSTQSSHARQAPESTHSITSLCDPRMTVFTTFLLMISAFSVINYAQLFLLTASTMTWIILSRISLSKLFASTHTLLAILIFSGLLNILVVRSGTVLINIFGLPITHEGIRYAILFASRFILVVLTGTTLIISSKPTILTQACASLLKPLRILGVQTEQWAFVMSLSLRFLPTLNDEMRSVALAQRARGGSIHHGSCYQRIRAMIALVIPSFAGIIRHSETLSLALDARNYVPGAPRTYWHQWRLRGQDWILLAITFSIVFTIVYLGIIIH